MQTHTLGGGACTSGTALLYLLNNPRKLKLAGVFYIY